MDTPRPRTAECLRACVPAPTASSSLFCRASPKLCHLRSLGLIPPSQAAASSLCRHHHAARAGESRRNLLRTHVPCPFWPSLGPRSLTALALARCRRLALPRRSVSQAAAPASLALTSPKISPPSPSPPEGPLSSNPRSRRKSPAEPLGLALLCSLPSAWPPPPHRHEHARTHTNGHTRTSHTELQ
jgi:hypothetical protein